MSMKNSSDTIGNRTRNLPACSAVPQPTVPLRTAQKINIWGKITVRSSVACSGKIIVKGSEVFSEVSMKITDFLDTTPCNLIDTYKRVPNIRHVPLSYTPIRRAVSIKSKFTNGDLFCWHTLLECIHYTTWSWPFKGRNMLQWRIN
jgi:hypothetical protein